MIVGTHSLISENVEFSALRIAVVDEQHRFGVIQRGRFNSKVVFPPWLSMVTFFRKYLTSNFLSFQISGSYNLQAFSFHLLASNGGLLLYC